MVCNSIYRANFFAKHTGNIAGCVYCNGIEAACKASRLRTNSHTSATLNAGVPANIKNNSFFCTHHQIFLYAESGLK